MSINCCKGLAYGKSSTSNRGGGSSLVMLTDVLSKGRQRHKQVRRKEGATASPQLYVTLG